MKINQEVFDATDLTEIEILRSIPQNLIESSKLPFREHEDYELAIVDGQVLRYILTTRDELEVEYVGIEEIIRSEAEIIKRAGKARNKIHAILNFNSQMPDTERKISCEQEDILRKAFEILDKLKDEEYIEIGNPKEDPDCELPF